MKTPEEIENMAILDISLFVHNDGEWFAAKKAWIAGYWFAAKKAWLAGYEAAMGNSPKKPDGSNQTNLLTPAKWISVKDRLPEYDQLALLWQSEMQAQFVGRRRDSGLAFPLYYWECTEDFFEAWKEIYFPKLMHQEVVTHWMPLPAPPKEAK